MIIRTVPIQVFHSTTRDSHIELFETSVDVSCRENELLRMFPTSNPAGQHGYGRQELTLVVTTPILSHRRLQGQAQIGRRQIGKRLRLQLDLLISRVPIDFSVRQYATTHVQQRFYHTKAHFRHGIPVSIGSIVDL